MQPLIWLLRAVVVIVLVWLAAKNTHPVSLFGLLDQQWQAPLVLVLLLFFVAGVFLGLVAAFSTVFRLRRQLAQFRKDAAAASDAGPEARTVADPSAVAAAPRAVVLPPHGD